MENFVNSVKTNKSKIIKIGTIVVLVVVGAIVAYSIVLASENLDEETAVLSEPGETVPFDLA